MAFILVKEKLGLERRVIKHSGKDSVVNSLKFKKNEFRVPNAWYESEEFATKNLKILFN